MLNPDWEFRTNLQLKDAGRPLTGKSGSWQHMGLPVQGQTQGVSIPEDSQVEGLPGEPPQANGDAPKGKNQNQNKTVIIYTSPHPLKRRLLKWKYKINQSQEQEGTNVQP